MYRLYSLFAATVLAAACAPGSEPDETDPPDPDPNLAPEVSFQEPADGTRVDEGTLLSVALQVGDDRDALDALQVSLASDLAGDLGSVSPDAAGLGTVELDLDAGNHVLTAQVTDSEGAVGSAEVSVVINGPPTRPTVVLSPGAPGTLDDLVAEAVDSTDPNDDPITFTWRWFEDDVLLEGADADTLPADLTTRGRVYRAEATPTDGSLVGEPGEASVEIVNAPPVISPPVITPSRDITTATTLNCSATATDVDGEEPTISYAWEGPGSTALGTGEVLVLGPEIIQPTDTVRCVATALDEEGATSSSTASVEVGNIAPLVTAAAISPGTGITTSTTLTCSASALDADLETPTLSYRWRTGAGTLLGAGDTVTLDPGSVSPTDTVQCEATAEDGFGGTDARVVEVTVENTPPTVDSVAVSPSTGITTSSVLNCIATTSDADGEIPTVTYSWTTASGTVLGSSSTLVLDPRRVDPTDTVRCEATAEDGYGGTDSGSTEVTVENTDPVISAVTVTPSSGVTTTSTLTCSATATDADGETPTLTYAWTAGGASLGSGATLTLDPADVSPTDTVRCEATATDGYGGTDSDSDAVTVDNTDPVISAVTVSPASSVTTSTRLTCSATVTDADGETPTLTYAWTVGSTSLGSGASLTLDPADVSPTDTVTCTATATDGYSGTDTGTDSVTVDNTEPTVDSIAISPSTGVTTSTRLTCTATASDEDDETPTLSYAWTTGSGMSLGTGATLTLDPSDVSPTDTVTCTATATDGYSGTGTDTASVTVDNTDPVLTSTRVSPATGVTTSTRLTCSAVATDADDETPTLTYAWSTAGGTALGTGASITLDPSDVSPTDRVTCTATATDGYGGTDTGTSSVTLVNTDPVISAVTVTPSTSVTTSTRLTCAATVTDADGETPTVTYAWTTGGGTSLGSGARLTLDPADVSPTDTVTCTATATDGYGGTDAAKGSVTVDNTDPTIDSVSVRPSTGVTTSTRLTCSAKASDADLETPTITYAWTSSSGTSLGSGSVLTLDPKTVSPTETVTCTATATDGYRGTGTDTASVTVDNTDPVLTAVRVSPTRSVTTSTRLTCTATATDADDETPTITYAWTGGSGASLGTGATLTLDPSDVSPRETVTCTATATDGYKGTDSAKAAVTTINTAPIISAVTIKPVVGVTTSTTLSCSASVSDADDETPTLAYEWSTKRAGVIGKLSRLTLDPKTVQPTDVVTCSVTATDGYGGSDSDSSTVTVGNTAPEVQASIRPRGVVDWDTRVTCTGTATDADLETPKVTYAWTDAGGTSIGSRATLDLDTLTLSDGDVLTCTTTATDGYKGSATDTDTVEVHVPRWLDDNDGDADDARFSSSRAGHAGWSPRMPYGSMGDFDGDGSPDLVFADPYITKTVKGQSIEVGGVYVMYGSRTRWSGENDLAGAGTLIKGDGWGDFTDAVALVGDVNDDGFDDILVGAQDNGRQGGNAGAAYLVYGSKSPAATIDLTSDADVMLLGETEGDEAGRVVMGPQDLDDDGYADLIVTAPFSDSGRSADTGAIYLTWGDPKLAATIYLSKADVTWRGDSAGDNLGFGPAVEGGGDFDGDGVQDLLFASEDAESGYLVLGDSGLSGEYVASDADLLLDGSSVNSGFFTFTSRAGIEVALRGDFDDDGYDDVAIGATGASSGKSSGHGSAFVVLGTSKVPTKLGLTSADIRFDGLLAGDALGTGLAWADLDGDGTSDLLVGAPGVDDGSVSDVGAVYGFYGDGNWSGTESASDHDVRWLGLDGRDKLGSLGDVVSVGDLDGDKADDFLLQTITLGACKNSGCMSLFYGG